MNEGSSFGVGRKFTRRAVLEAFDDSLERSREEGKGESAVEKERREEWSWSSELNEFGLKLTVFPVPFDPTITVTGLWKSTTDDLLLLEEDKSGKG